MTELASGMRYGAIVYYAIGASTGLAFYLHQLLQPERNNDFGVRPFDGVMMCVLLVSIWPLVVLAYLLDDGNWRG